MARPRDWVIMAAEFETEADFREAVAQELAGLEHLGHRTGGAYISTPIRLEAPEQRVSGVREFEVIGWVFQQQFMPAARRPEPEASAASPEPEGDEETERAPLELASVAGGDA